MSCLVVVIYFMNDEAYVIRKLVSYQAPRMILGQLETETDEGEALQMLSALTIMERESPFILRPILVEWVRVLDFWSGIVMCSEHAEHLLEPITTASQPPPSP